MKQATFAGVAIPYSAVQRSSRVVRQRRVRDVRLVHRGQGPRERIENYRPEPELVEALKGLREQPHLLTYEDAEEELFFLGSSASHSFATEEGYSFELSHRFSSFDPAAESQDKVDLRDLAVSRLRDLIERDNANEEELRRFLTENAFLLYHFFPVKGCLMHGDIYAQVPLGDSHVADFVGHWWCNAGGDNYVLIAVERASTGLFGDSKEPGHALTAALNRIRRWHAWIEDDPVRARETFPGLKKVVSLVFLGRRRSLDAEGQQTLRQLNEKLGGSPYVSTYDALLDSNDTGAGSGFGIEFQILPGAAIRELLPASGTHPNYGPGHPLAP